MNLYWVYHYSDRYIGIPICMILSFFDKIFFSSVKGYRTKEYNFSNILVIKLTMIGDTILLTPTLEALRKELPSSRITMLCSPVNEAIVREWNFIDNHLVFDYADYFKYPWKLLKFVLKLRKHKFDLVIDFETWPRIIPIISYLSGAKTRVGFKVPKQFRHYLFTHPVRHIRKKHEIESFIDIVNVIGIEVKKVSLQLPVAQKDIEKIERILYNKISSSDRFVIIHPGAGIHSYYRAWSEKKYAEIADYLIEKYNIKIVITGSKEDLRRGEKLISYMKNRPVNLIGKTTLKELFALVSKCLFVICGNTGIMHIASALGKKTIAIHGPTDPDKWGPWGEGHIIVRKDLPCSPCSYLGFEYGCKNRTCLDLITVDEVKNAVDKMMDKMTTLHQ